LSITRRSERLTIGIGDVAVGPLDLLEEGQELLVAMLARATEVLESAGD